MCWSCRISWGCRAGFWLVPPRPQKKKPESRGHALNKFFDKLFLPLVLLASLALMLLLKRAGTFSILGVSVAGGVGHNLGQILVAAAVLGRGALWYLPALLVSGVLAGAVVGAAGAIVIKRIK